MGLLPYFLEYFKINNLTFYFLLFLFALPLAASGLKFLRLSWTQAFVMVLLLGMALRIGWIATSSHEPQWTWQSNSIENDWINIHATELTHGTWFHNPAGHPSGRRPIGYPLFLGGLYALFGSKAAVAWTAHLILFAASAILIFLIGRRTFGERAGFLAAFFFCIYPISIYSTRLITDEHLFLPVWYLGLYLILREADGPQPKPWSWLWYGLCFGYAVMIRTHAIFMPGVLLIARFCMKRPWKETLRVTLLTGAVMLAVNLPWAVRNYRAWNVPVLFTATGCNVYMQVNDTALPRESEGRIPGPADPGFSPELQKALASGNEGLSHQICNREMKRWIIHNPAKFIFLGARKLLLFMSWNRSAGVWPLWYQYTEGHFDPARPLSPAAKKILEELAFAFYYILLFSYLLSLILLPASWKKLGSNSRKGILILGTCVLFWLLEHLLIAPDRKYRFPLEPLMMLSASSFWIWLVDNASGVMAKIRSRRTG